MSKFSVFALSVCLTGAALLGLGGAGAGLSGGVVPAHRFVTVAAPADGGAPEDGVYPDSNGWWSTHP
jgi:hypothetical protein